MHETYLLSLIVSDFVCHMCDGGDDNKVGYGVILLYVSISLFVIVFVYVFCCVFISMVVCFMYYSFDIKYFLFF
jgi:hypothetical protein